MDLYLEDRAPAATQPAMVVCIGQRRTQSEQLVRDASVKVTSWH